MRPTELTHELVREYLDYDPDSGIFAWKKKPCSHVIVGSVAGYSRPDGYRLIGMFGMRALAHRIAWLWMTGSLPDADIDHIDGDPSNNAFGNLRVATRSLNNANSKARHWSRSGLKGAIWCKKDQRWYGRIAVNGRSYHLGSYLTAEEAHEAYKTASVKFFGEFARAS